MKSAYSVLLTLILLPIASSNSQELQNFVIEGRYFYGDSARGPITGVCVDDGYLYLAENFDTVRVFAIDENGLPAQEIGGSSPEWGVENLYKFESMIVAVTPVLGDGYDLFDVAEPGDMRHLCHVNDGAEIISHPRIDGIHLYTPVGNYFEGVGMKCYDISDPSHPILTDWIFRQERGFGYDFATVGTVGYLSFWGGHPAIINVANPDDLREIGSLSFNGGALGVFAGNLFVGPLVNYGDSILRIYDISAPSQPVEELAVITNVPNSLAIQLRSDGLLLLHGFRVNVGSDQIVSIWDVGGFEYPQLVANFTYHWYSGNTFLQFDAENLLVYYAAGDSGLFVLRYTGPMPINTGDVNASGEFNGVDVVYMVNWFRASGPLVPEPPERGDANGDCIVNGVDVAYMVNYLKGLGPEPIRAFCYGR